MRHVLHGKQHLFQGFHRAWGSFLSTESRSRRAAIRLLNKSPQQPARQNWFAQAFSNSAIPPSKYTLSKKNKAKESAYRGSREQRTNEISDKIYSHVYLVRYRRRSNMENLTTAFLSSLSTLRQSSRNDDMMPDFGLVKRLLMKLSGAFVSSSLYRNQQK